MTFGPIAEKTKSDQPFLRVSNSTNAKDMSTKDICFKIFVVASIVLAAIVVVAGILALMASKGALPGTMDSISKLSVIGEVNSYVMLGGGTVLFVLGILAWSCQLRKENMQSLELRTLT
jgi:hypothetical protein